MATVMLMALAPSAFGATKHGVQPAKRSTAARQAAVLHATHAASRTDWMAGSYGIMTHFLPCVNTIDEFNAAVDVFDVKAYTGDIKQTGAKYVIFTLGQGNFFCSPNATLSKLCGNVTSRRDLFSEVAAALAKEGIRTIAYIPSGAPDVMAGGVHYKDIDSGGPGRRAAFQNIWQSVVAEYSRRWGQSAAGWWFDGMYDWQKMYAFTDGPCFRTLAAAARTGNSASIVSFNDGNGPYSNHSEFADCATGEVHRHEQSLPECEARWIDEVDPATKRPYKIQWNVHTFLGHEFVGNGFGGPNDTPRFPNSYVTGYVKRILSHGGTCQFDVPIHAGGCNDPTPSLEGHLGSPFMPQLAAIAHAIGKRALGSEHLSNVALNTVPKTNLPGAGAAALGDDGSIATDFESAENDQDVPFWQIDLGSKQPITAVQLVLSQTDGNKAYRNEVQFLASNDPEFKTSERIAWMMEGFEVPEHQSFYTFMVKPASYRYIRISRPPKDYHVFWWKPRLKFAEVRIFKIDSATK